MGEQDGPFVIVHGDWSEFSGREDVIVLSTSVDDGALCISFPQFDIECCGAVGDDVEQVLERALEALFAFNSAMKSLPANYINVVEAVQLRILNNVLAPWFMDTIASRPSYLTLPPDALDLNGLLPV